MEPSDPSQAPAVDVHAPFTRAERMDRLAEIDQDIVSLLALSGKAIQSLGKQSHTTDDANQPPAQSHDEQTQTFQENMDQFLTTLHKIDVRMKREVFALEEAGILTIDKVKSKDDDDPATDPAKPTLEPNGMGMVGNLDVGWLNSRSNQVEREMEAELWANARKALESVAHGANATGNGVDVNMTNSGT